MIQDIRSTKRQQDSPSLYVQSSDQDFRDAFTISYCTYCHEYQDAPLTDDAIFGYIQVVFRNAILPPHWKAGDIAGWFAAAYHIAYPLSDMPIPQRPRLLAQPLDLRITEPLFGPCFQQGYDQAQAQFQGQPATDDLIYTALIQAYRIYDYHHTLTNARRCAGLIAGWMASLYCVPCHMLGELLPRPSKPSSFWQRGGRA